MKRLLAIVVTAGLTVVSGVLAGAGIAATSALPAHAAVGGPVILGGDDLTDHGSFDTATNSNVDGWLYIQRALENVSPRVSRANDGTVAAVGSAPSTATSSDGGGAITHAAAKAGIPVTFHDGATDIQKLFDGIRTGVLNPRILWLAGDDAGNDLDSSEIAQLTANASVIADFVNAGGGLISHGTDTTYGWLTALLPGATAVSSGASGDLVLTPAGTSAFPGLTATDVNAGPWHNHFEGDLGNLGVLVESTSIQLANGQNAPVIIGGAQVRLPGAPAPYVMVGADGGVFAPGGEGFVGTAAMRPGDGILRRPDGSIIPPSRGRLATPVVAIVYTSDHRGGWLVTAGGDVIEIGNAPNIGDLKGLKLRAPIVGAVASKDGGGLLAVAADGGVFALGSAGFRGSLPGIHVKPAAPIVGITLDPDGSGYILAGRDGGAFAFDAPYAGNALGISRAPIVGIAADPDGTGYLFAARDGGVFAVGAAFSGSAVGLRLQGPIIGIATNPNGQGYWLGGADGGVFAVGGAPFMGSLANVLLNGRITGIVAL